MATLAAIIATIAGVAIVFQLAKNVGSASAPVTGLSTVEQGLTGVTTSLFTK